MKLFADKTSAVKFPVETLVLFAFEGADRPAGSDRVVNAVLRKMFADAAANEGFKGKEKSVLVFYPADGRPARRILVAGLGKKEKYDSERLRRGAAQAAARCRSAAASSATVLPPGPADDARRQAQAIAEGFLLSLYQFKKYKSKKDDNKADKPESLRLLADTDRARSQAADGLREGDIYSRATCVARDLVNEPAAVCTPRFLADAARDAVRGDRSMTIKVFDEKQIERLGMGGLRMVSLGSEQPPRFVHMAYRAPGAARTIAIVGKGITFDSGGLCIKPADGMLNMKDDMAGAATVIAVFRALRELRPKVNVHGILAATENMPGGGAYKTRDVVRAMNGKTMEIVNTDAEGRVILSDALAYASKLQPDEIIDMATLTGACVVALGQEISGIFATDQQLVDRLLAAGRSTGEKIWQLPLEEEYADLIKSDVADMKNSGGRWGGSITAALFLKEFVEPGIPWAHIDIAGPALTESAGPYKPAGGTGAMVRTILQYLQSRAG